MIDPDALNVWYGQQLVGYLWRDKTGKIGYRYNDEWLEEGGFSVSVSLPLSSDDYSPDDAIAHHFFANLLPEGNAREQIVTDLKIANTEFELLRAIGGECAGALSILADDQEPSIELDYDELTDVAVIKLIQSKGNIYTQSENQESKLPRLSLAGAQNKCPILVKDDKFYLPRGEAPSSHILKFTIPDYRHVPAYETVLTSLAKKIGLNTVEVEFKHCEIGDREDHYIVVKRYDRYTGEFGDIQRAHQEDFCQAIGVGHEKKYEENGGVSFSDCYKLIQNVSSRPAPDTLQLLKWQIFNYVAGNSDGHAKNLSLLYDKNNNITLAPFYDLVCTRAIERIDEKLAFSINGEKAPGNIFLQHWAREAEKLGVRESYLLKLLNDTIDNIQSEINPVIDNFQNSYGEYPALQRVSQVIEKQCSRALKVSK